MPATVPQGRVDQFSDRAQGMVLRNSVVQMHIAKEVTRPIVFAAHRIPLQANRSDNGITVARPREGGFSAAC